MIKEKNLNNNKISDCIWLINNQVLKNVDIKGFFCCKNTSKLFKLVIRGKK
tara:strand:- start:2181 stop:2333 length:153 start_codon:yes stop_codon:yes gene_type:complete